MRKNTWVPRHTYLREPPCPSHMHTHTHTHTHTHAGMQAHTLTHINTKRKISRNSKHTCLREYESHPALIHTYINTHKRTKLPEFQSTRICESHLAPAQHGSGQPGVVRSGPPCRPPQSCPGCGGPAHRGGPPLRMYAHVSSIVNS